MAPTKTKAAVAPPRKKPISRSRQSGKSKVSRILVPTDFSAASDQAAEFAKDLAIRHKAEIILVHVVLPAGSPDLIYGSLLWDQQKVIRSARTALQQWQSEVGLGRMKKLRRAICVGVPHTEIVETARSTKCDLIVIPTHGRTGLKHYLLGGTAERVVRHAHCPVLVVRAG
jgi:nucleotide-binding universal stress UspA family protein